MISYCRALIVGQPGEFGGYPRGVERPRRFRHGRKRARGTSGRWK
jgi:hypothetical protein